MKAWSVQDAKARFSELLETCMSDGPQVVTKRGAGAAVLVKLADWERMQQAARPGLKALLLAPLPHGPLVLPPRGRLHRRKPTPAG